jgi:hypothetical protein
MKINVTFECQNLSEFHWISDTLRLKPGAVTEARANGEVREEAEATKEEEEATPAPARRRGRPKAETTKPAAAAPEHPAAASVPGSGALLSVIPELQQLKDTITVAARKAMKKEGPTTILDLLPSFREATGLDFVMNATEDHRMALYELAVAAGIAKEVPL